MWPVLTATEYLLAFCLFWLLLLSYLLIRNAGRLKRITTAGRAKNLDQILENILTRQNIETKQIADLINKLANITNNQKNFLTKHALIRFNPFEDTGGDQSFALSLLDGENNGIVISSLHSRGGTRIYAKQVSAAKPTSHPFSKEEKEVVEKAARQVALANK